jgi:uncharacterized Zn-binding protein involved in type VI secretion
MKGCTYIGALSTGHICYPPTALVQSSQNVYVNFKPAGRLGDLFTAHACPCDKCPPPHTVRAISDGPLNVYFNMRPPGRIGDQISCGDKIAQGSFNVFAGSAA